MKQVLAEWTEKLCLGLDRLSAVPNGIIMHQHLQLEGYLCRSCSIHHSFCLLCG